MRKMMKRVKRSAVIVVAVLGVVLGSMGVVQNYADNDAVMTVAGDEYPTIEAYSLSPDATSEYDM